MKHFKVRPRSSLRGLRVGLRLDLSHPSDWVGIESLVPEGEALLSLASYPVWSHRRRILGSRHLGGWVETCVGCPRVRLGPSPRCSRCAIETKS